MSAADLPAESIWSATAGPPPRFAPLSGSVDADVAIVGGGMTGMLCAQALLDRGLRVALVEARRIGAGSTANSTGNLYAMVGVRSQPLPPEQAAQAWQARRSAIDQIEALVRRHGLDCSFARRRWTLFSNDAAEPEAFARVREVARRLDLPVHEAADVPVPHRHALAIDGQAQLNPSAFVRQLAARLASDARCRIFEDSAVLDVEPGEPCRVVCAGGELRAPRVIFATHTPKGALKVHAALGVHREYGIALPIAPERAPRGIFWSAGQTQLSLRAHEADSRAYLVIVGSSHKTGQAEDTRRCLEPLLEYARAHFGVDSVTHRWSAQNYKPADGLPYIGESAWGPQVRMATGYSADGLTWAQVAARILAAEAAGSAPPEAELFAAGRFTPLASAKSLAKDSINVAAQYVKDLPGHGDVGDAGQIERGHGAVLSIGGEKIAAFRDEAGALHCVSAVCTHMQCLVHWNTAERSWDCPCHGSRFTPQGEVIEGPALAPLARARHAP